MVLMVDEPLAEDPNVQRLKLGLELRTSRENAELTQRAAADVLEWSLSKLTRIEAGAHAVSVSDLKSMIDAYSITDQRQVDALMAAARGSRGHGWWSDYRDIVSPQFARYLGIEGMAECFRVFHPFLVPGLLQTQEYAAELLTVLPDKESAKRLVNLKMERQERLFAQPGVSFTFAVGEEALHRWIGGPRVMRRQLEHLADLESRTNVTFQIVPFGAGAYPGLLGSFNMLRLKELKEKVEEVLFQESASGDQFIRDNKRVISTYIEYFETIIQTSLPPQQGDTLLREQISRLRRAEYPHPDSSGGR